MGSGFNKPEKVSQEMVIQVQEENEILKEQRNTLEQEKIELQLMIDNLNRKIDKSKTKQSLGRQGARKAVRGGKALPSHPSMEDDDIDKLKQELSQLRIQNEQQKELLSQQSQGVSVGQGAYQLEGQQVGGFGVEFNPQSKKGQAQMGSQLQGIEFQPQFSIEDEGRITPTPNLEIVKQNLFQENNELMLQIVNIKDEHQQAINDNQFIKERNLELESNMLSLSKENEDYRNQLEDMFNTHQELFDENQQLKQENESLQTGVVQLTKENQQLTKLIDELKGVNKKIQQDYQSIQSNLKQSQTQNKKVQVQLDERLDKSAIESQNSDIKQLKDMYSQSIYDLQEQNNILSKQLKDYQEAAENYQHLKQQNYNLEIAHNNLEREREALSKDNLKLSTTNLELQQNITQKLKDAYSQSISDLQEQNNVLSQQLQEYQEVAENYKYLQQHNQHLEIAHNNLESECKALSKDNLQLSNTNLELQQNITQKEGDWELEKKKLKNDIYNLKAELDHVQRQLQVGVHARDISFTESEGEQMRNELKLTKSQNQMYAEELTKLRKENSEGLTNLLQKDQALEIALQQQKQQQRAIERFDIHNKQLLEKLNDLEQFAKDKNRIEQDIEKAYKEKQQIESQLKTLMSEKQNMEINVIPQLQEQNKKLQQQLSTQHKDLLEENDILRQENATVPVLRRDIERLNTEIDNLNKKLAEWKKKTSDMRYGFTQEEHKLEQQKDDLEYNISQLRRENESLKQRLKNSSDTLEDELAQRQAEVDKLQDELKVAKSHGLVTEQQLSAIKAQFEAFQSEAYDKQINSSEEQRESRLKQGSLIQQIQQLQDALKNCQNRISELAGEKDELRKQLQTKGQELEDASQEFVNLHESLYKQIGSPTGRGSPDRFPTSSIQSPRSSEGTQGYQEMMIIEGMSDIQNEQNPLLINVSRLRRENPMTYSNVWKLFEALMHEKCKLDKLEISLERQPRTMTEYMLDFVYVHYGLKSIALKQLKALIASLENLYKLGHPYGVLFCRFLGLFHPRPLSYHLTIYLLMIQEQFTLLTQKVKGNKPENFAQQYDIIQYGGHASLIDVMELIAKICKRNRDAGERIISSFTRESITRLEVTIIKVCGTMARMGRTSDFIFHLLDVNRGGYVTYDEFIDGIRHKLNIWVTQDEVEELCQYIDEGMTGVITYNNWCDKVDFVSYAERVYNKVALVTKCDFMNSLVEEYEYEVIQDYYSLRQMLPDFTYDRNYYNELLLRLDPTLEERDLRLLYEEAVQHEGQGGQISSETFCIVVLKHRVGGFGVGMFGELQLDVNELDQSLPKVSTEGVKTDLVVERDMQGNLAVGLRKKG